jgi:hypothetical protein
MLLKNIAIITCTLFIVTAGFAQGILNDKDRTIISSAQNNFDTSTESDPVEVIDQQQTEDIGAGCPFFDYLWIAQSFIPKMDTLTKVELKLFKYNNPTTPVMVSIRSSLTGEDLAYVTRDASDVHSSARWIEFDFTDININPGEMYYIVCRTTGGSAIKYYCCMFYTNNPYPHGTVWGSLDRGSSWDIIEYPGYPDPDGCFKTYGLDESPDTPYISGPTNGNINVDLTYEISSVDPEGDNVYYYVDWNDGTNSGWMGPYASGLEISMTHFWEEEGSYRIKVKAKDVYGVISEWGTLDVNIPRSYIATSTSVCLQRFIDDHPSIPAIIELLIQMLRK